MRHSKKYNKRDLEYIIIIVYSICTPNTSSILIKNKELETCPTFSLNFYLCLKIFCSSFLKNPYFS